MNVYELSRAWFDFCFENPEKISTNHSAIFFFAIEHCNRLGWKDKFGFPTQMTMDAIGIKKHQTYIKYFNELVEWGFFNLIQKSTNQYSANIISIRSGMPKKGKALDKAIITHRAKQTEPIGQSTGQSNSSIDKPIYQFTKDTNLQIVVEEDAPEPFEILVNLRKVNNLPLFVKEKFARSEEQLKMKVTSKIYSERQEAFILRNNERSYTDDNDFKSHYTNFILKPIPLEKEKYSGQKEKPNKVEQFQNSHNAVISEILRTAGINH